MRTMLRVWLALGFGVAAVLLSGLVVSMARAQSGGDPAAVVTAYEMARNRRDIDGALAYFADDATVSQRSTTFTGKDDIRKFLDGISTRARFSVVADRHTTGNRVTWTERAAPPQQGAGQQTQPRSPGLNGAGASSSGFQVTVEAVVQDGKIRSLTYLSTNQPALADPSLDGRAQLPAGVGLGAVLALMFGVVMVASIGLGRSTTAASTLHGRLMQDLRGWTAARQ